MKVLLTLLSALFLMALISVHESFSAGTPQTTRTNSGGGVTVKAAYLEESEHESRFSVALDTHSVNLDGYDLKTLSVLRDDAGLTLTPTRVENKGSGHHREVVLTFPRLSSQRKWSELVIKDVAGVKERTFRWDR
jgi:hypothetical protein